MTAPLLTRLEQTITITAPSENFTAVQEYGDLPRELDERLFHARRVANNWLAVDLTLEEAQILYDEASRFNLKFQLETDGGYFA
jgi:hypothetical protein